MASAGSGRGHFFSVMQPAWWTACELGMNAAVALLVLARFSGRDNATTAASVNAIEKHTGISRSRARDGINALVARNLARPTSDNPTRPRYVLTVPPPKATGTGRRGSGQDVQQEPVRIWLPNALVTGAATETPPVELIRQTQDPLLLRLLVDLYSVQNLRDDGSVRRGVYWRSYDRERVWDFAEWTVWGFSSAKGWVGWTPVTEPHRTSDTESPAKDIFARFNVLTSLGLMDEIWVVYESDGPDAEPVISFDGASGLQPEHQVWTAASLAAKSALPREIHQRQRTEGALLLPFPRHLANVCLVQVPRLKYRPRTRMTAAWWARMHERSAEWTAAYENLATRASGAAAKVAG
jgi:hypothetical protein